MNVAQKMMVNLWYGNVGSRVIISLAGFPEKHAQWYLPWRNLAGAGAAGRTDYYPCVNYVAPPLTEPLS